MLKREDVPCGVSLFPFIFFYDGNSAWLYSGPYRSASDLGQLSKDCLEVKVGEAFISGLPHQCQWCNAGKHQVYPWLGKVLLEGNYALKWLGLLGVVCWILGMNTCAILRLAVKASQC